MKIKTLKEVESSFEILTNHEKASMLGGTGIYSPTDPTLYLGDMDFTNAGYITYFSDDDYWNSGGYVVAYEPGIDGGGFTSGYGDWNNNRFQIMYLTEDYKAYYVDNLTGGYFLDTNNQAFAHTYDMPSGDPNFPVIHEYYDQFTGGYARFYAIY
jgi:hypothetical protein